MSKSDTKNRPSSLAVLVFFVPVGTCVTVTSAPDTLTTPLIDEVVSTSAKVDVENINRAESTNAYYYLGIFFIINLVNNLSAINNVLTGLLNSESSIMSLLYLFNKEQKLEALKALDTVGLLHKAYDRADQLSGGQRQRVGIALSLIHI